MITKARMHGIARYVFHLLQILKSQDTQHQFVAFVAADSPLKKLRWPQHISLVTYKAPWISFREQLTLPLVLRRYQIDLFHATSFVAPYVCPCPLVMTIHDLNHLVLPQFYTPLHLIYYRFFVKRCIRHSRYLLTVSNFSKSENVRNLKIDPAKIFVTYNGVSEHYKEEGGAGYLDYIRDLYELPEQFIFCLSNNKPHKNIHQLVRAYCFSNLKTPLVLACPVDASLIRLAEGFGKKHQIYFSKYIAEEHLPGVYSLARFFVYPSTYEGFGLPPLEALACGVPVVVARSASLPEVVGRYAYFVDPYDYQDMAKMLEHASGQSDLGLKSRHARVLHARSFSWKTMAQRTLDVYNLCGQSPNDWGGVKGKPLVQT